MTDETLLSGKCEWSPRSWCAASSPWFTGMMTGSSRLASTARGRDTDVRSLPLVMRDGHESRGPVGRAVVEGVDHDWVLAAVAVLAATARLELYGEGVRERAVRVLVQG